MPVASAEVEENGLCGVDCDDAQGASVPAASSMVDPMMAAWKSGELVGLLEPRAHDGHRARMARWGMIGQGAHTRRWRKQEDKPEQHGERRPYPSNEGARIDHALNRLPATHTT